MHLSVSECRSLTRILGLLAEDTREYEIRARVGHALLDLLRADYFASYVWDEARGRFGCPVTINMDEDNLRAYEAYYQFRDPITYELQAKRVPTLVTQVMPQRELIRTEFFNDFLARDGLHWGVNAYSYVAGRHIGDLRIWRGKGRDNFDAHTLDVLRLIEPAFTGALHRALLRTAPSVEPHWSNGSGLSPREQAVATMVGEGYTDKQIAQRLGVEQSTVRTYLKRVFDKLGVQRRSAVAAAVSRLNGG